MTGPASIDTIARLHNITTLFHVFVYFAPELPTAYNEAGVEPRSQYFGSRTAAMGPLPHQMVAATFYNFNPAFIEKGMEGLWDSISPADLQLARWRGVKAVLDAHVRPAMSENDIEEAIKIAERSVAGLTYEARPLAAGNAAVLPDLAASEFGDDRLLLLWQLVTIIREWRGDVHIGLLAAEPLTAAECTVISYAQTQAQFIKTSRAWEEAGWNAAVESLIERGWIAADDALTDKGRDRRAAIEARTNELSAPIWAGIDDAMVNRLGDLLKPGNDAMREAGIFKAIGLRPKGN